MFVRGCSNVNVGKLNANVGSGVSGDIVFINCKDVTLNKHNERYKISTATMEGNEVLRTLGATANRPKRAHVGFDYFDTSLGKPVFVKTKAVLDVSGAITTPAVWVDGAGTTV